MNRRPIAWAAVALLSFSQAIGQSVDDPHLAVETVVTGLDTPTTLAFIAEGDILVLQKNDGRVRRVIGGVLQPGEVLDVSVDSAFDKGLLGIAVDPDFANRRWVYLYYSEADADGGDAAANRVYRYTWDGSALVDPHLVLELPNSPALRVGGILVFGADDMLYTVMGDLERLGKLENVSSGPDPDDTAVILRTHSDGTAPAGNPFFGATGSLAPMRGYYAYGIRNSFGMAVDPRTGALWDTENTQVFYDEINRVEAGFNSGWVQIMGPDARDPQGIGNLWSAPGSAYSDPEFSWHDPVAPTAIAFIGSPKLGCARLHDVLVGDFNCGRMQHFVMNPARDGFTFLAPDLQDLVADNVDDTCFQEQAELGFGSGFGIITDIETGPDGLLYVVSLTAGSIYRIAPELPPALDADADGVDDACDCDSADPEAWAVPAEVPRLRLSGKAATSLGWDTQGAAAGGGTTYDVVTGAIAALRADGGYGAACTLGAGLSTPRLVDGRPGPPVSDGFYYLVRALNACGKGTYGDAGGGVDPRDVLDTTQPPACP